MAAGIGSRFGGLKQLAEVGPNGEAFLDFAIIDGLAAGIEEFLLIVRSEIREQVRSHVDARHPGLEITLVCQDQLGPPRDKPWGTGHAVLAAAREIDGPFLVCNADDYYGPSTYRALSASAAALSPNHASLAGFHLDQTLPESGNVSRGVCTLIGDDLVGMVETHGIGRRGDGRLTSTDPVSVLDDDTPISMNFWAFHPTLLRPLERAFTRFLNDYGGDESAEFLLPNVIPDLVEAGDLSVKVVQTSEAWVGITNPDDLVIARHRIAELRAGG
jgi:dTDP-glucose pyrophosphorylase